MVLAYDHLCHVMMVPVPMFYLDQCVIPILICESVKTGWLHSCSF